jgi:hypothetical protein
MNVVKYVKIIKSLKAACSRNSDSVDDCQGLNQMRSKWRRFHAVEAEFRVYLTLDLRSKVRFEKQQVA